MGLAIVAIPEQGDRTYKVSSEKVPHCTLLFLGDAESADVQEIARFLEHAISSSNIGPFMMEVDHRGTLGPDQADVLFFQKRWSAKRIQELRGQLLQNRAIRDAYDSTSQFGSVEEWVPHLTLGYPRAPAREDKEDHPIRWVDFDRIALWTGDYTGPEFRLEYQFNDDLAEVAMSVQAERGRDYLEHYGVRGMKWGQRKESSSSSTPTEVKTHSVVNAGLRKKTKIKSEGGQAHEAHPDAIKAAIAKQKLKKSGPAALSNKDLKDLQERLNLEKNVSELTAPKGKKFVKGVLKTEGQRQVQEGTRAGERKIKESLR